ncbi:MAG: carbon-nitrogen hydrolase [Lentisphaeria bacterium]|nr:carbon-nitrogen hydrolase [Lentisphaeria bacterium]
MSLPTIRIGLLQDQDRSTMAAAAERTEQMIREAAAGGAKIICTQELFLTEYFCWKQDSSFFDLAVTIPSEWTDRFCRLANELSVVLVLSLFERRAPGLCHNTAVVIDADGTLMGKYRKMHIPQDPGFEEKFYFAPGDLPYRAFHTKYADIGVLVCWDQWYPEAARLTALSGAQIIFCPTAIGGIASEPASLADLQRDAWLNVQRGHAVANGCFWAAVNRVGIEHGTRFWGSSFAADFYGNHLVLGDRNETQILYADCDLAAMEEHRRMWPFFRDRRIDSYSDLMRRFND